MLFLEFHCCCIFDILFGSLGTVVCDSNMFCIARCCLCYFVKFVSSGGGHAVIFSIGVNTSL